ncbi:MAG: hypothetical protein V4709_04135 [Pseudomonadota bacterium]
MLIRHPEADARMARSQGLADYWPQLARYPLTGYCLPVILMLVLLITLAMQSSMMLPGGIPDTGLPLLAISVIWIVFYLIRVIDHTARGYATPPPMGSEALYLAGAVKPLALPAIVSLGYFALAGTHKALADVLLAVALFVMPAYLFIYATEERLAAALNPLRWLKVIAVMGAAYLLPCLLLVAGAMLLGRISGTAGVALLVSLCCYGLFGTAHVLGYLGFKRQHALGLQVDVRDPDEVEREEQHAAQLKELLRRINDWQRDRDEASALRAIESHSGGPLDAIRFYEELFHALCMHGSPALIHATGRRLITRLLATRKPERALDIAEGCLNSHWHFMPSSPTQLEALLRQAIALRFDELYERLLKGAETDLHLAEPAWASVQFLRAQYQSETRQDDVGALALLQAPRGMTQHPRHELFERTAKTLESLLARQNRRI